MFRFYIEDSANEAALLLDRKHVPYDFDSNGRIMVTDEYADEAVRIWDENCIDYDEI